ncbi:MAG TPA: prepilin-type N-terminal cleavage/methylation domain-containing protein [Rhizomicrobium sp.]|jgi:general secretion pathway protein J|nr:prepilin-type N-terminal cleavage/methylation domain-containing protein [Rhizomicrobium sp.]
MTRQTGFTLIELLVSMTLLALLFVLLLGGMRFGTRAWERSTQVADDGDSIRSVQNLLRRELERACPRLLPTTSPQDATRIRFTGDGEALRILAPAPGAAGGQSCAPTTLRTAPDGRLQQIAVNDTPVLRHVQALEIAYLPAQGDWRASWRNQPALPALIRIRVTFPKDDGRSWPELFIVPRISADGDCTYDPQTKLCRGT